MKPDPASTTLDAFCDAVDWSSTNKRLVETMTGALDVYGDRAAVLALLSKLSVPPSGESNRTGQMDLFGMMSTVRRLTMLQANYQVFPLPKTKSDSGMGEGSSVWFAP